DTSNYLKDYLAIHFPEAEWIELAKMNELKN
ncbi:dethiobiotin synthase, partial [Acinetobacter baumannii]